MNFPDNPIYEGNTSSEKSFIDFVYLPFSSFSSGSLESRNENAMTHATRGDARRREATRGDARRRDAESDLLEEVDLALGGARLLPSVRQRAQVVDRADDVVAALLLMMVVTRVRLRRVLRRLLCRRVRLLEGGRAAVGAGMRNGEAGRGGDGGGGRDRVRGAVCAAATAGASATAAAGTRGTCGVTTAATTTAAAAAATAAVRATVRHAAAAAVWCRRNGGTERGIRRVLARVRDRGALATGGRWIEEGIRQVAQAQRHLQRPLRVGLQDGVEESLEIGLGILVDPDDGITLGQLVHVLIQRHFGSHVRCSLTTLPLPVAYVLFVSPFPSSYHRVLVALSAPIYSPLPRSELRLCSADHLLHDALLICVVSPAHEPVLRLSFPTIASFL